MKPRATLISCAAVTAVLLFTCITLFVSKPSPVEVAEDVVKTPAASTTVALSAGPVLVEGAETQEAPQYGIVESPVITEMALVRLEELPPVPVNREELMDLLSLIRKVPGRYNRRRMLTDLGEAMGAHDFSGSLKMIQESEIKLDRDGMIFYGLFTSGGAVDPQAALAALEAIRSDSEDKGLGRTRGTYYALIGLMKGWTSRDLAGASAYVDTLSNPQRGMALSGVYRAWGEMDPATAIPHAMALSGSERWRALRPAFLGWARQDPVAAAEYAQANLGSSSQRYALWQIGEAIAYHWADGDAKATAEWIIDSFPETVQRTSLPSIYDKWAVSDPRAALEHASTIGVGLVKNPDDLIGDVLGTWYLDDPAAAQQWADSSIADDSRYLRVMIETAQNLGYRDPAQAAALMDQMPELQAKETRVVDILVPRWIDEDPQSASQWVVNSIEDVAARERAVKWAYAIWAKDDMPSALESALQIPGGNEQAYALSNVAIQQSQNRMEGSADWIRDLDPGFARDRSAAGYVLGALRGRDSEAAKLVRSSLGSTQVDMDAVTRVLENAQIDNALRSSLQGVIRN